jgi:hypothetical protein
MKFTADIEPLDHDYGKGWTIKIAASDKVTAEKGLRVVHGFLHSRGPDFSLDIDPLHSAMVAKVEGGVELIERVISVTSISSVRPDSVEVSWSEINNAVQVCLGDMSEGGFPRQHGDGFFRNGR